MSLRASKLSKLYDQKWVLRDVSFETERGEIFGLFGASGSGKTTLLKLLAGVEKPNGGTVLFDSVDVTNQTHDGRGFILADGRQEPAWNRILGRESKFPSGIRKLEALRKAVHSTQNVLLLDDPFAVMDSEQKQSSLEMLRNLARAKKPATIVATSSFEDVLFSCNRVAVIADSEIVQTGTPENVYLSPASRAVARMTGRHNLFSARRFSSSKADLPQFQTIEGSHRLTVQKVAKGSLGALNQNVTLGVRPEHISISFEASFPEDNLIKASIRGIRFMGPNTLVELEANGLRLDAIVPRLVGLSTGDECMLGLPPDRIVVYRD